MYLRLMLLLLIKSVNTATARAGDPLESVIAEVNRLRNDFQALKNDVSKKTDLISDLQKTLQDKNELIQKLSGRVLDLEYLVHAHNNLRSSRDIGAFVEEEIGFTAKVSNHLTGLGPSHVIVFDGVITNLGGAYNGNTGMFTAPVSGTYLFYATVMSERDNYVETEIVRNGSQIVEMYSGGSNFHDASSNFAILGLQMGERVWVQVHGQWSSDFRVHCCFTTFSGYLLRVNLDPSSGQIIG